MFFRNIEELRELIKNGKSNKEIIKNRLAYLNSEEYKQSKLESKYIDGTSQIYFHEGFISKDMLIAADGGDINDKTLYSIDDVDLYSDLIDILRKNIDKKGFPLKIILKKVYEYFQIDDNSQYKELINYFKENFPNDPYFSRTWMPYIIDYYNHSTFKGNITEFGRLFALKKYGTSAAKIKYEQEIQEFSNSVDWHFYDKNPDPIFKISQLKGSGFGACTEKSMLLCNCLSFLGYDCYMLSGKITKSNNEDEEHHFVVVKNSQGEFVIVDAALYSMTLLENINSPSDLLYLQDIKAVSGTGENISYYSRLAYNYNKTK